MENCQFAAKPPPPPRGGASMVRSGAVMAHVQACDILVTHDGSCSGSLMCVLSQSVSSMHAGKQGEKG